MSEEVTEGGGGGGLIALIILPLCLLLALPVGIVLLLASQAAEDQAAQEQAQQCEAPGGNLPPLSVTVDPTALPKVKGLTDRQVTVAAVILKVGEERNIGQRGQLIALMTAMQESKLGTHPGYDKPDENHDAGIFQQRILPGWYGTLEQVNDLAYSADMFYRGHTITEAPAGAAGPKGYHIPGLLDIKGWDTMELTAAAQAVQGSGFPNAYAQWEPLMTTLMKSLASASPAVTAADASDAGGAPPQVAAACNTDTGAVDAPKATDLDSLPRFPTPAGCTDQTPVFGPYGANGLNGNVPASALCKLPGALDAEGRIQVRAVAAYIAMNADFRKQFGHDLEVSSTYRTYAKQQATKRDKGFLAATPGYSNHGFGLAIDIRATDTEKKWVQTHGPKYGWWHPLWARPDGQKPENWHYEYGTWLLEDRFKGMDPAKIVER